MYIGLHLISTKMGNGCKIYIVRG